MATRRGDTLIFPKPPVIAAHACIGGKKEGESPLAAEFDELHSDNRLGQASWEAAETQLQLQTARLCLKKAHATEKDVSLLLAGDLQAQCTASGYAARALGLPFAGLFGACSTMAEALGVGACLCSAGMADGLLAMTSSHFCTAERQFRTPLSYGAVRPPTAQWTATAAGACLLRPAGQGVGIRAVTFGRVQDLGIRDINNMGAAMAPAAAATLLRYLTDTNTQPQEFDAICTGDLGHVGSQLFRELLAAEGVGVITGPILTDRSKPELAGLTIENPARLAKAGVEIAICTDHPVTPIQYLPLCAAIAVRGGLEPEEALRAITLGGARLAGVAHRVGSLTPGKDADVVVTSGHPLEWTGSVEHVFINGIQVK